MSQKVVWVLGAGFSRALGGPLLTEMLSAGSREDLKVRFKGQGFDSVEVKHVHRLYQFGHRSADRPAVIAVDDVRKGERDPIWGDAEEFLAYLDIAASQPDGPEGVRVQALINKLLYNWRGDGDGRLDLKQAGDLARKVVAAECTAFLHPEPSMDLEIWDAYRRWAAQLDHDHTIISFNYDRVLELLRDRIKKVEERDRVHVVSPKGFDRLPDRCNVLKLHGSVDWDLEKLEVKDDPLLALKTNGRGIATPGPTKRVRVEELKQHWEHAVNALKRAEAIVFIGFRFPPSDVHAKQRLLNAIAMNESTKLAVHIVLGEPGKDTERLKHMLREVCNHTNGRYELRPNGRTEFTPDESREFFVRVHPLFAEDFFVMQGPQTLSTPP